MRWMQQRVLCVPPPDLRVSVASYMDHCCHSSSTSSSQRVHGGMHWSAGCAFSSSLWCEPGVSSCPPCGLAGLSTSPLPALCTPVWPPPHLPDFCDACPSSSPCCGCAACAPSCRPPRCVRPATMSATSAAAPPAPPAPPALRAASAANTRSAPTALGRRWWRSRPPRQRLPQRLLLPLRVPWAAPS